MLDQGWQTRKPHTPMRFRRLIINVRFDKFSAENVTIPTLDFQGDKYHWKSIYQDVECYFNSGINCKSIKR